MPGSFTTHAHNRKKYIQVRPSPVRMAKSIFEFIARYPIQMLIAGGILLIIIGQTTKTTGAATKADALMQIGGQTSTWGLGLVFVGVVLFLIYIFRDRF